MKGVDGKIRLFAFLSLPALRLGLRGQPDYTKIIKNVKVI